VTGEDFPSVEKPGKGRLVGKGGIGGKEAAGDGEYLYPILGEPVMSVENVEIEFGFEECTIG
jgi:hypothetical protein